MFSAEKSCSSKSNESLARSFHRKTLPSSCTPLNSKEGKILFKEALLDGTAEAFFPLCEQFRTQDDPAFCGPSTLCMSLNALAIDPKRVWKGIWRWFHEDMILERCNALNHEMVKTNGVTLEQFVCLANANGAKTPLRGGSTPGILRFDEMPIETFRSVVENTMKHGPWCERINCQDEPICNHRSGNGKDTDKEIKDATIEHTDATHNYCFKDVTKTGVLVISYNRPILGQTGSGHFSPIAAYHKKSDQVLILDVARFKYPPHWVSLCTLYSAMETIDKSTGKSRGIILLEEAEEIFDYVCTAPKETENSLCLT